MNIRMDKRKDENYIPLGINDDKTYDIYGETCTTWHTASLNCATVTVSKPGV